MRTTWRPLAGLLLGVLWLGAGCAAQDDTVGAAANLGGFAPGTSCDGTNYPNHCNPVANAANNCVGGQVEEVACGFSSDERDSCDVDPGDGLAKCNPAFPPEAEPAQISIAPGAACDGSTYPNHCNPVANAANNCVDGQVQEIACGDASCYLDDAGVAACPPSSDPTPVDPPGPTTCLVPGGIDRVYAAVCDCYALVAGGAYFECYADGHWRWIESSDVESDCGNTIIIIGD